MLEEVSAEPLQSAEEVQAAEEIQPAVLDAEEAAVLDAEEMQAPPAPAPEPAAAPAAPAPAPGLAEELLTSVTTTKPIIDGRKLDQVLSLMAQKARDQDTKLDKALARVAELEQGVRGCRQGTTDGTRQLETTARELKTQMQDLMKVRDVVDAQVSALQAAGKTQRSEMHGSKAERGQMDVQIRDLAKRLGVGEKAAAAAEEGAAAAATERDAAFAAAVEQLKLQVQDLDERLEIAEMSQTSELAQPPDIQQQQVIQQMPPQIVQQQVIQSEPAAPSSEAQALNAKLLEITKAAEAAARSAAEASESAARTAEAATAQAKQAELELEKLKADGSLNAQQMEKLQLEAAQSASAAAEAKSAAAEAVRQAEERASQGLLQVGQAAEAAAKSAAEASKNSKRAAQAATAQAMQADAELQKLKADGLANAQKIEKLQLAAAQSASNDVDQGAELEKLKADSLLHAQQLEKAELEAAQSASAAVKAKSAAAEAVRQAEERVKRAEQAQTDAEATEAAQATAKAAERELDRLQQLEEVAAQGERDDEQAAEAKAAIQKQSEAAKAAAADAAEVLRHAQAAATSAAQMAAQSAARPSAAVPAPPSVGQAIQAPVVEHKETIGQYRRRSSRSGDVQPSHNVAETGTNNEPSDISLQLRLRVEHLEGKLASVQSYNNDMRKSMQKCLSSTQDSSRKLRALEAQVVTPPVDAPPPAPAVTAGGELGALDAYVRDLKDSLWGRCNTLDSLSKKQLTQLRSLEEIVLNKKVEPADSASPVVRRLAEQMRDAAADVQTVRLQSDSVKSSLIEAMADKVGTVRLDEMLAEAARDQKKLIGTSEKGLRELVTGSYGAVTDVKKALSCTQEQLSSLEASAKESMRHLQHTKADKEVAAQVDEMLGQIDQMQDNYKQVLNQCNLKIKELETIGSTAMKAIDKIEAKTSNFADKSEMTHLKSLLESSHGASSKISGGSNKCLSCDKSMSSMAGWQRGPTGHTMTGQSSASGEGRLGSAPGLHGQLMSPMAPDSESNNRMSTPHRNHRTQSNLQEPGMDVIVDSRGRPLHVLQQGPVHTALLPSVKGTPRGLKSSKSSLDEAAMYTLRNHELAQNTLRDIGY